MVTISNHLLSGLQSKRSTHSGPLHLGDVPNTDLTSRCGTIKLLVVMPELHANFQVLVHRTSVGAGHEEHLMHLRIFQELQLICDVANFP